MDAHIAELFLDAKEQILKSQDYSVNQKIKALFNLLTTILEEVTQTEKIVFTTLFSRASFVANKLDINPRLMFHLHTFRRANELQRFELEREAYLFLGQYVLESIIEHIYHEGKPNDELEIRVLGDFPFSKRDVVQFKAVVEIVVVSINFEDYVFYFYENEDATELKKALFDRSDKNELFNRNIRQIEKVFDFPLHANLIDVEILEDGTYLPNALVLIPDYLLDVTAVSNCFKPQGVNVITRLIAKFKQVENSIPLMVGNIANLFLDEIISNPDVKFKELLPKIFKLDPLGMSNFNDGEIRELVEHAQNHYLNLKRTIAVDLPRERIDREQVFLEPTFFSRDFGLQGRLDLFHIDHEKDRLDIIELKSGKPFRANVYGLSANHYSQTLLYDLMVRSAYGGHKKRNCFILYSRLKEAALKFAPSARPQQYESLSVRNELMVMEYKLAKSAEDASQLFHYLQHLDSDDIKGFELVDLQKFQRVYAGLNELEKNYFNHYCTFIAREQRMAKTGEHGINKSNGLAGLWLENIEEKEDRFGVLKALTISENYSKENVPTIVLRKSEQTNALANFREGDIAILYPSENESRAVLKNQIFKCTISNIDSNSIAVRLRSKQYNDALFRSIEFWNIEADSLDSGFNMLYRSLYEFCNANKPKRGLWLGSKAPARYHLREMSSVSEMTEEQNRVVNEMLSIKDYYLLWGPPGTGKTSVVLRSLTAQIFETTSDNILLLAYTNRAVDEICMALESIGDDFSEEYIRLGSRASCDERFRPRMLDQLIMDATQRKEIRNIIQSKRIYVSTVASIVSKADLFKLKKFDWVIVDEASQIIEPLLLGLLSKIDKAILIGDHKQLPAVVTQRDADSRIENAELLDLGITDMRMSLFERLFQQCKANDWNHAYGSITYQGRMHRAIMKFPNHQFYENKLKVLPNLSRMNSEKGWQHSGKEETILVDQRFIYIPTKTDLTFNWKTNIDESNKVVQLLKLISDLYERNGVDITISSIGVITPYRAQIAVIRKALEASLPEIMDRITVDTVERYQGGARDIIILSLCTNKMSQLKSLVSLSQEGIDRKLNVAMTRAREQLIILGNKEILSTNPTYQDLMGVSI